MCGVCEVVHTHIQTHTHAPTQRGSAEIVSSLVSAERREASGSHGLQTRVLFRCYIMANSKIANSGCTEKDRRCVKGDVKEVLCKRGCKRMHARRDVHGEGRGGVY